MQFRAQEFTLILNNFRLYFSHIFDMLLVIESAIQQTYKDFALRAVAAHKLLSMLLTDNPKRSILGLLLKISFECFRELEDFIVNRASKTVFLGWHKFKEAHETEFMPTVNHNLLSFSLVEGQIASLAG